MGLLDLRPTRQLLLNLLTAMSMLVCVAAAVPWVGGVLDVRLRRLAVRHA